VLTTHEHAAQASAGLEQRLTAAVEPCYPELLLQIISFGDLQACIRLVEKAGYKELLNPAYNRGRGPVSIVSLRVHS
jgi:hypothetical protein